MNEYMLSSALRTLRPTAHRPTRARRLRVPVVAAALPLIRSVPLLASFLLSAPRTWHHHGWARYALATTTAPLGTAAVMGLFELVFRVGGQQHFDQWT